MDLKSDKILAEMLCFCFHFAENSELPQKLQVHRFYKKISQELIWYLATLSVFTFSQEMVSAFENMFPLLGAHVYVFENIKISSKTPKLCHTWQHIYEVKMFLCSKT